MHQEPDLGRDLTGRQTDWASPLLAKEFYSLFELHLHWLRVTGSIALGALTLIYNIELSEGRTEQNSAVQWVLSDEILTAAFPSQYWSSILHWKSYLDNWVNEPIIGTNDNIDQEWSIQRNEDRKTCWNNDLTYKFALLIGVNKSYISESVQRSKWNVNWKL